MILRQPPKHKGLRGWFETWGFWPNLGDLGSDLGMSIDPEGGFWRRRSVEESTGEEAIDAFIGDNGRRIDSLFQLRFLWVSPCSLVCCSREAGRWVIGDFLAQHSMTV